MSEEEEQNRFSLRKLSIGLASVLVGVSIFGTSQTVKADTVADQNTSAVTSNAQSSDTQENKNAAKSSFSSDNQANNVKSNLIQTQVEGKKDRKQDSVPKTQEATDSSNLDAEKDIVSTSSLQEPDNQSNNHAEDNSQTQNSQKLDLTKNSKKLAKKVLATNLIETNSSPTTNGGFDEATWGKLDVNDWQGQARNGVYELINYTGDPNHVIVPNEADFEKAVKIPHVNGYKARVTRNKLNPAMLMVSFMAVPTETKPSNPIEETPSKPSANADNTNKPADDLKQRVVTELNSNDSGWTMPTTADTHVIKAPTDTVSINLSDLMIAEPVHAQTSTKIRVTKRFKLSKKHSIKHLKHRKKAVRTFRKYRL